MFCVVLCIVCFVSFCVLFVLCRSVYCLFCVVLCIVCFVSFCVLYVCKCVLYYCHRVATQLQLTNISYMFGGRWGELLPGSRPLSWCPLYFTICCSLMQLNPPCASVRSHHGQDCLSNYSHLLSSINLVKITNYLMLKPQLN